MDLSDMKIGVFYGGPSREREISMVSGKAVLECLVENRMNAVGIEVGDDIQSVLAGLDIDVAFIALHGAFGEDGGMQRLLEDAGIPYSGSGVSASRLAMNKADSKRVLLSANIPTAAYKVLKKSDLRDDIINVAETFGFPFVVKPVAEGSSIGVYFIKNRGDFLARIDNMFEYGDVLIERVIDGRELTVGIIGAEAMPIIELRTTRPFYDFEAKYVAGDTEYVVPARLDETTAERVRNIALKTFNALGAYGFGRVDLMLDKEGNAFVLELNTIPGFTGHSLVPKAASVMGLTFIELINKILELALCREASQTK